MQHLLDQAAWFNMFSIPDAELSNAAIRVLDNSNRVIGITIRELLHRFEAITEDPTFEKGLTARNVVGETVGKFTQRWMVIPDDFEALPGREPPPTTLDPSRSQRFAMLDGVCKFGDGEDGFRGFGTGFTIPSTMQGRPQILAVAVGTILEGFGKLKNHEQAVYVYGGSITPDRGFTGSLLLRVMDPEGTIPTGYDLPPLEPRSDPERGITYIVIRGQAREEQVVKPVIGPDGQFKGLQISQDLRLCYLDCTTKGRKGLESVARMGQVIGVIDTLVSVNPADPGGTLLSPIPGRVTGDYVFYDAAGQTVGSFKVDFTESRSFRIELAGAAGAQLLLVGNIGRIFGGNGPFEGIGGLATDNLLVSFVPHVSSGMYVLRIHDPVGKFRAAINGA